MEFVTAALIAGMSDWVLWLIVCVVAAIAEIATVNLVSIWFVIGAFVALVASLMGAPAIVQLVLFFTISIAGVLIFLLLVKPHLSRNRGGVKTNADRIIGKEAVVTETIDTVVGRGQIRVENQVWSARIEEGHDIIEIGTKVRVIGIKGVKAIIERM